MARKKIDQVKKWNFRDQLNHKTPMMWKSGGAAKILIFYYFILSSKIWGSQTNKNLNSYLEWLNLDLGPDLELVDYVRYLGTY